MSILYKYTGRRLRCIILNITAMFITWNELSDGVQQCSNTHLHHRHSSSNHRHLGHGGGGAASWDHLAYPLHIETWEIYTTQFDIYLVCIIMNLKSWLYITDVPKFVGQQVPLDKSFITYVDDWAETSKLVQNWNISHEHETHNPNINLKIKLKYKIIYFP